MKRLMADNQCELMLGALPEKGAMLEWGSGGTSLWLAERLSPDQRLISVEHDRQWASQLNPKTHPNWRLIVEPPLLAVGRNATHFEECPAGLASYICRPEVAEADVILIDGVARGACLVHALTHCKPGTVIFLHDVADTDPPRVGWYEWAMETMRHRINHTRIIKSDGTYPPALMEIRLHGADFRGLQL